MTKTLSKLEDFIDKIEVLEGEDPVVKAVEDLSDFSVKRNVVFILDTLKKEINEDRYTPEGLRFILMFLAGNLKQL